MNILRFFFFNAFWLCLQVHVIYGLCHFSLPPFPPHDRGLTAPERGCGLWGESQVMEAHHSRNWNGNFLIQEDDLCSQKSQTLLDDKHEENCPIKYIVVCTRCACSLVSSLPLLPPLRPCLLFLFHFIKTRLWNANCENHFLTSRMCRTWQRRMCSESVVVTFSTYDNVPLKF